jgi:SpoVK/Ycf46/Vps4 family AAA+-type ATPase
VALARESAEGVEVSASSLVLDLMRSHYRGDSQAFRSFALRLARMTKSDLTRKTMLDVIQRGGRDVRNHDGPFQPHRPPEGGTLPQATAGLLEPTTPIPLDELLYEPELRTQLDEIVLEIAHRAELAERNLTPRGRLLFCGPPGNGKTSAASAIAHELDVPAFTVTIPALISKYLGGTGENLNTLFRHVGDGAVVVLDEIDAIGGQRVNPDQAASKEQNSIVNAMLTLLDTHRGGTLVATTNRLDVLDPALIRRFDDVVYFPAPNDAQKAQLMLRLCDRYGIPTVEVRDCGNYDAVTKRVTGEARRIVMREILAAKAAADEDLDESAEAAE